MWWLFFTVAVLVLLFFAGTLAVLEAAYKGALEAYRLAKFTFDQWASLAAELNRSLCIAAEDKAAEAVKRLDIETYRSLGKLFQDAVERVREVSLLKRLNATWGFQGDVFYYTLRFRNRTYEGRVDWLRPSALIDAVNSIKSASFDLSTASISDHLRPLVPNNARLTGVVEGVLTGNGTYTGVLKGYYTLTDKTLLKCTSGYISVDFTAEHYATLTINSTAPSVYVYEAVYIDR